MKYNLILTAFCLSIPLAMIAQKTELDENAFDFWVGDWELTWTTKEGIERKGINKIVKILDDSVVQENFEDMRNGFKGTSISVYNPRAKKWYQSWADNKGGYFSFEGTYEDGNPIFKTLVQEIEGHKVIRRMVFRNITEDSFVWDWEISLDNGSSWELKWQIQYQRKSS